MSQTKHRRVKKRQLGQFMTPSFLARSLVEKMEISAMTRVLEPGFGDGSFILSLIEAFMPLYSGSASERLGAILTNNIFGIEIDPTAYDRCIERIAARWGKPPRSHNLICADFFRYEFRAEDVGDEGTQKNQRYVHTSEMRFDYVIGNPPFGGTIDLALQEQLDRKYGFRNGDKIKKETYAFFIVRCIDQLKKYGRLLFICSDTFMT